MVKHSKLKKFNAVDWTIIVFFAILVVIAITPFINVFSLSISDNFAVIENPAMILPNFAHTSLASYISIFRSEAIYSSFLISLLVVVCSTLIHVVVTLLAGFSLSNHNLPGRSAMLLFVLFTMLFGGGLVPTYLVISSYNMIDTFWVLVIPGAVSGYNIILMKNFIINIPDSLIEAAEIDGANPMYILWHVIAPLCIPIIAVVALMFAVGKWNDWMTGFLYIKEERWLWPFQNVLQNLVVNTDSNNSTGMDLSTFGESFKNALIVVSLIPVILMYMVSQKYLIKGIFVGSVKG